MLSAEVRSCANTSVGQEVGKLAIFDIMVGISYPFEAFHNFHIERNHMVKYLVTCHSCYKSIHFNYSGADLRTVIGVRRQVVCVCHS